MSQILANSTRGTLLQDFSFQRTKTSLKSSAASVGCHVCGKGLEHGRTITAKNNNSEALFFCNIHF